MALLGGVYLRKGVGASAALWLRARAFLTDIVRGSAACIVATPISSIMTSPAALVSTSPDAYRQLSMLRIEAALRPIFDGVDSIIPEVLMRISLSSSPISSNQDAFPWVCWDIFIYIRTGVNSREVEVIK